MVSLVIHNFRVINKCKRRTVKEKKKIISVQMCVIGVFPFGVKMKLKNHAFELSFSQCYIVCGHLQQKADNSDCKYNWHLFFF